MNLDFDIEEITSILGIKNKFSELENIIRKKENLSFLSAIELILENPESNKLIPKSNTIQPNQSEMFINFTETLGITDIQKVELKDEIKESKFEEGIKTKNNIYKNINLYFSEDYKNKIKNDFILPKEEEFETIDAGKFQIEVVNQNKKEKRPKKSKNKGNNNNNNINVNVEDNIDISMNTSQNDSQQNQNINKTKKNSKKSKNSSNNNIPKPQNKNSQKYNIDEIEGEPLEQFQQSQHQNISMKKQKHKKNMQTSPQPIVDNYTNNNMNNPIEKKKKPKKKKANKSNMSNSGNNIDSNNDNQ